MFKNLGEEIFDDYWMNYSKITIRDEVGKERRITNLRDFLEYKRIDTNLINTRKRRQKTKRQLDID